MNGTRCYSTQRVPIPKALYTTTPVSPLAPTYPFGALTIVACNVQSMYGTGRIPFISPPCSTPMTFLVVSSTCRFVFLRSLGF